MKILIDGGHITSFDQIFLHIPKSVVAKDYGSNHVRFARKVLNPATLKIIDIKILAGLFDIDLLKMIELILVTINVKRGPVRKWSPNENEKKP